MYTLSCEFFLNFIPHTVLVVYNVVCSLSTFYLIKAIISSGNIDRG